MTGSKTKFAIVVFPGSNCEQDCYHIATELLGCEAEYVWHHDTDLKNADVVILPGGFAYGDYLRAGALARFSPVMESVDPVRDATAARCSGSATGSRCCSRPGLLPGAVRVNRGLRYVCRDVHMRVENADTVFTRLYEPGQVVRMPIGHGEGNYTAPPEALTELEYEAGVVFRYCDEEGRVTDEVEPQRRDRRDRRDLQSRREHRRPDAAPGPLRRGTARQRRGPEDVRVGRRARSRRHDATGRRSLPDLVAGAQPLARGVRAHPRDPGPRAQPGRARHLLGDVERALLLQVLAHPPEDASRRRVPRVIQGPGRERRRSWTSATGSPSPSRWSRTTIPSYIEPYQGAATGVGGILRDIFTMGARPIASLDSLRFGALDAPRMRHLVDGVVRGIARLRQLHRHPDGRRRDDASTRPTTGNILVNVMNVGRAREGPDLPGPRRGRRATRSSTSARRPGATASTARRWPRRSSPGTRRSRSDRRCRSATRSPRSCCSRRAWSSSETDAVVGIQDMGAAGLTSSSFEMAGRAGSGVEIDLSKVPVREKGMTPYEIMLSESQERMLLVARRDRLDDGARRLPRSGSSTPWRSAG